MFSQSGTQTPVASSQQQNQSQKIQFHEVLGETITWVNDWYLPNLNNTSNQSDIITNSFHSFNSSNNSNISRSRGNGNASASAGSTGFGGVGLSNSLSGLDDENSTPAISDCIRLKGWHKTNINHKQNTNVFSSKDVLDLNKWKYFRDPIIDVNDSNDKINDNNDFNGNNNNDNNNSTDPALQLKSENHGGVLGEVISF